MEAVSCGQIYDFLCKVDKSFPVPLSEKVDLKEYSAKLISSANVLVKTVDGSIAALVAGYTENLSDNSAYIAVVGVLEEYRGKGFATMLVNEFISLCKAKNISSVNLYTHKTNVNAIKLYEKIGFSAMDTDVNRPDDLHLLYKITE